MMRPKFVAISFFLLASSFCHAQTGQVKGRVTDAQSGRSLPFASIYINLTTIGTYANDRGEFSLTNLPVGTYNLIVSYIGHQPYQAKIKIVENEEIFLAVSLTVVAIKEVVITAKRDDKWYKQMDKFKRLFLGQGQSAKLCKILNPYALTFAETESRIFTAQATDPLEIENMYLGYRVTYDLKNFAVSQQNYIAAGYVRFQEMETTDTLTAKRWMKNRLKAYEGSVNHFFKSLVDSTLEENDYAIFEDRSEIKRIVRNSRFLANLDKTIFIYPMAGKVKQTTPGVFKVQIPSRIEVHYRNDNKHSKIYWDIPNPVSWIEVKGGFLDVTADGLVLNPLRMTISGNMFEARLDELLPNNFHPQIKKRVYRDPTATKNIGRLAYLSEKPYLQADRSYYYPNEIIWFKGYINYQTPAIMDSLSRVLYVELVDKNNTIITSGAFPIGKGVSAGNLMLPETIVGGDHTLRAFTRWMLNFDTAFVFVKPVRILASDELARYREYAPDDKNSSSNLVIESDKEEYDAREQIILTLKVRDALDNPATANLSISVTDVDQAVPAENETSILNNYAIPDVSFPDTLGENKFTIQHGFDLKGRFITSKEKSTTGILTFVQENVDMQFSNTTEEDGSFYLPDLILYDSSKLSFVARTPKGKYGRVIFDSLKVHPSIKPSKPLQIEVYKTPSIVRRKAPDFSLKATLLSPVTVRDTRLESNRTSIVAADFTITGDWLRERNSTDVLSSIQTKVPGMRIMTVWDGAVPMKHIVFSGGYTFGGLAEPLVLIDGQVVNDFPGGPAAQISNLNPNEIDRIEVNKYGSAAVYGVRGANGVIAIFTRRDVRNTPKDLIKYDKSKLQPLRVSGYSTTRNFASPRYSNPESTKDVLDNRATIYWNPNVATNGSKSVTLSFFAADLPTQYRIIVEGITKEGLAVRGEKKVTVRKAP